jgi:leader peptidase (prepilin peptidase)/N-methyltransferase
MNRAVAATCAMLLAVAACASAGTPRPLARPPQDVQGAAFSISPAAARRQAAANSATLRLERLRQIDQVREAVLTTLFVGYFFVLGAVVGSFLNVVAWRMPRGQGLLFPGSRCPSCGAPIALRDNVPILSWLVLRGRCRRCQARIRPRYLLVEAATGGLFLLLACVELLTGGANLPAGAVVRTTATGVMGVLWETKWGLIGLYVYHAVLISLLLAMALIRLDRQRIPARLIVVGLLLGLVPPLAWPWLRPEGAADWSGLLGTSAPWLMALLDGGAGVLVGLLVGSVVALATPRNDSRFSGTGAGMLVLAGAWLGWQAAVAIGAIVAAALVVQAVAGFAITAIRRWPPAVWVLAAVVGQLCWWDTLDAMLVERLIDANRAWRAAIYVAAVASMLGANWLRRRWPATSEPPYPTDDNRDAGAVEPVPAADSDVDVLPPAQSDTHA